MWASSPLITLHYHGHEITVHEAILKGKLAYFYRAANSNVDKQDIGVVNFHPESAFKIIDLPWPGFCALLEWAYTDSLKPLLSYQNDVDYWSRVALVLGIDSLQQALARESRWNWIVAQSTRLREYGCVRVGTILLRGCRSGIDTVCRLVIYLAAGVLAAGGWVVDLLRIVAQILGAAIVLLYIGLVLYASCVCMGIIQGSISLQSVPPDVRLLGALVWEEMVWSHQLAYCMFSMATKNSAEFTRWCELHVQEGPFHL